ncbi:MAG TPA: transcriptional regulator NrdR [Peptococcaceae bacterium]|nr:transcriptional regulator NrdR [Peptococcaceae bacterium]
MKCPSCGYHDSKVLETRDSEDGIVIRRRRECIACQRRFTTFERMEEQPLWVVKKDGSRQRYDSQKVLSGMMRACEKRPVPYQVLEQAVNEIERELRQSSSQQEIPSMLIGEKVMEHLKRIDEVAYVRFASVYREFKDIKTFLHEIQEMLIKEPHNQGNT